MIWLIDRNQLQGFGRTEDVLKLNPLPDKIAAFGFDVLEIDGHEMEDFFRAQSYYDSVSKPLAIICNTVKGNAVNYFQNTVGCHYLPMKDDQFEQANADVLHFFESKSKGLK